MYIFSRIVKFPIYYHTDAIEMISNRCDSCCVHFPLHMCVCFVVFLPLNAFQQCSDHNFFQFFSILFICVVISIFFFVHHHHTRSLDSFAWIHQTHQYDRIWKWDDALSSVKISIYLIANEYNHNNSKWFGGDAQSWNISLTGFTWLFVFNLNVGNFLRETMHRILFSRFNLVVVVVVFFRLRVIQLVFSFCLVVWSK